MKALPLVDRFTLATVRITAETPTKVTRGTGFFVQGELIEGWPLSLVVTNKHVVANARTVSLNTGVADSQTVPLVGHNDGVAIEANVFERLLVNHPDPDVDLCGIITWPIIDVLKSSGHKLSHRHIGPSEFVTFDELERLSAVEDVIVVGYPTGLWDQLNNRPIVRRGITATHPNLQYNGRAAFLIDAPCFPGSSGSPVLLYQPEVHLDGDEVKIVAIPRLLGVLAEAPTHREEAPVTNAIALSEKGASVTYEVLLNLGTVLQCRRVRELLVAAVDVGTELRGDLSGSNAHAS